MAPLFTDAKVDRLSIMNVQVAVDVKMKMVAPQDAAIMEITTMDRLHVLVTIPYGGVQTE